MRECVVGAAGTVWGNVWDLSQAPIKPKTSGTIYALVTCAGGANDGKFWDSNSGGSWQAYSSVVSWPTATYSGKGSGWYYSVPAGATTNAGAGNSIVLYDLTDNLTAASSTVIAGNMSVLSLVTTARETIDGRIDVASSTLAAAATAVSSADLTPTRAAKLDYLTGNAMLASTYVAPDNAGITSIKAKTDNLPAAPAAVSNIPTASAVASQVRTELATELARIDATTSSRAPAASAVSNATLTDARITKLDYLTGNVMTASSYVAPDNAGITAIKNKTDNLPAAPAATSDIPSAATNASAVRAELATELGRIDGTITSRAPAASAVSNATLTDARITKLDYLTGNVMTASSYVAPDNAGITAAQSAIDDLAEQEAEHYVDLAGEITRVPTAAANASAVRSEIATELARIDATTSSRQAADTAYADKVSIIAEVIDIQDYVAAVARAVVPDGLYTLSIDVVDEAAARVVGATIVVLSGDLDPLWRETTTGAGPVTVAVDAGTYHVRVSRPGYTIEDTDTEIAVSADTDLTLELIADTTSPAMCTIYGTLTGPAGAIVGATVEIEIRAPSENGGWNFGGSLTTTTDAAGYFAINAPQLSQVAITIDAIGWDHEIRTVPAQISRALTGWTA